jgi:hypothetical protein
MPSVGLGREELEAEAVVLGHGYILKNSKALEVAQASVGVSLLAISALSENIVVSDYAIASKLTPTGLGLLLPSGWLVSTNPSLGRLINSDKRAA